MQVRRCIGDVYGCGLGRPAIQRQHASRANSHHSGALIAPAGALTSSLDTSVSAACVGGTIKHAWMNQPLLLLSAGEARSHMYRQPPATSLLRHSPCKPCPSSASGWRAGQQGRRSWCRTESSWRSAWWCLAGCSRGNERSIKAKVCWIRNIYRVEGH